MAWYYYSGKTPKPVPVKKGASVSLRRGSTVEILMDSPELSAMVRSGELRKTGAPKGKRKTADILVPTQQIKDVMKPVDFAKAVVEIGTSGPGYVPVGSDLGSSMGKTSSGDIEDLSLISSDKTSEHEEKEIAQSDTVLEDVKEKIARKRRTTA